MYLQGYNFSDEFLFLFFIILKFLINIVVGCVGTCVDACVRNFVDSGASAVDASLLFNIISNYNFINN